MPPPKDGSNIKELIMFLTSSGIGLPVDEGGEPIGSWTPEKLAMAITDIDPKSAGIELRSVQNWFQKNDKGIGPDNIRRLAQIFGCNNPEATREWRVELSAAQRRLVAERRTKRNKQKPPAVEGSISPQRIIPEKNASVAGRQGNAGVTHTKKQPFSLPRLSNTLFSMSALNISAALWAAWVVLGILAFILRIYSVTYSPTDGIDKQVGFYWAPNWTLLSIFLLPFYLSILIKLLTFWKDVGRNKCAAGNEISDNSDWVSTVGAYSFSHWAVFVISFGIVFVLQWAGVYLYALMRGDASQLMVDWNLVAIMRPEIISRPAAISFSMLAFLFTGVETFLFLTGLVFLYIVTQDYQKLCIETKLQTGKQFQINAREVGITLMTGVFRCVVLGVLMTTCIKLQATYLQSDGETIVNWVADDALCAFGIKEGKMGWLGQRALADFTSFVLLFMISAIFIACFLKIHGVIERLKAIRESEQLSDSTRADRVVEVPWHLMIGVVVILVGNCMLIGQFTGFSILLTVTILIGIYSLYDPMFGRAKKLARNAPSM